MLWLAASGIALNHSASLGLDHREISAPWLIKFYGLHVVIPDRGFRSANHWLVGTDAEPSLTADHLPLHCPNRSALSLPTNCCSQPMPVASPCSMLTGQLVDALRGSDLPFPRRRVGQGNGVVVIADPQDHRFASRDGLDWAPSTAA